jgi:hypothetical protein
MAGRLAVKAKVGHEGAPTKAVTTGETPKPPRGASREGEPPSPDLPTLDFSTFVLGLIGTAYVHLGDAPDPDGQGERDLSMARQDIDLLGLLQEKTKGNLTGDEERLLEQAPCDLRMRYVEVARGA